MQSGSCLYKSLFTYFHTICQRSLVCAQNFSRDDYVNGLQASYQNFKYKTYSISTGYKKLKTDWTIPKLENKLLLFN